MHGPSNVPSFIFYLLGGLLLGFAYKRAKTCGFLPSPHVLQQLGHSYIIYKNHEKVSRRWCLPFQVINDSLEPIEMLFFENRAWSG